MGVYFKMQRASNVLWVFIFFLIRSLLASRSCSNLDVTSEWGDGLTADLHVAVDHQGHGWEILLTFDTTVSSIECWQATVSTTDSKTFKLVNSDEDISSGGQIELHLLVHFSTKPQLIAAYLDGQDVCGGGSADSTTTTTTTTDAGYKPDHPAKYDYGSVIEKSLIFFEAQR